MRRRLLNTIDCGVVQQTRKNLSNNSPDTQMQLRNLPNAPRHVEARLAPLCGTSIAVAFGVAQTMLT
jgi:hypothetical protein